MTTPAVAQAANEDPLLDDDGKPVAPKVAADGGDGDGQGADNQPSETEARARRLGWRPEAEWDDSRGGRRPARFLSADEYLDKVDTDVPVMRERLRFLDNELVTTRKEVTTGNAKLDDLSKLVTDLHSQNKAVGQRAYEKAKRDLTSEMDAAAASADVTTYQAKKAALAELEETKPAPAAAAATVAKAPPQPQAPPSFSPDVTRWVDDNKSWFNVDDQMTTDAIALHDANLRRGVPESESLKQVRTKIAGLYPDKFANARREAPAAVVTPGGGKPPKKGPSFDELPQEVKDTYTRLAAQFKAKGTTYSKEDYVKDYHLG